MSNIIYIPPGPATEDLSKYATIALLNADIAQVEGEIAQVEAEVATKVSADTDVRFNTISTNTSTKSAAAWGNSGLLLPIPSATLTDTSSSGTVASNSAASILAPTLAASSPTTYQTASTLAVAAPTAGTNASITNAYAVNANGNVRVNGTLVLSDSAKASASGSTLQLETAAGGDLTASMAQLKLTSGVGGQGHSLNRQLAVARTV